MFFFKNLQLLTTFLIYLTSYCILIIFLISTLKSYLILSFLPSILLSLSLSVFFGHTNSLLNSVQHHCSPWCCCWPSARAPKTKKLSKPSPLNLPRKVPKNPPHLLQPPIIATALKPNVAYITSRTTIIRTIIRFMRKKH